MNLKTYEAVRTVLVKLEDQLKVEAKADPRLKRGLGRITNMLKRLETAQAKYVIIHNRKVPAKVAAKKATVKKAAPKKAAKAGVKKAKAPKPSNVVSLPAKAVAQKR
jgi:hypothetical protein